MRAELNAPVLILGASARAAAQSARRAGLVCNAVDLFADVDLRAVCQTAIQAASYPTDLAIHAERLPPGPWLYTGALENYPDLIAAISASRPLLGNNAATLEMVRNPLAVADALKAAGSKSPVCALSPEGIPRDGTWLCKSLRSAGGLRVEPWLSTTTLAEESDYYWQQQIAGVPHSAVFIAAGGRAALLGISEMLVGPTWGAPRSFQYAGSIGPLYCSTVLRQQLEFLGHTLTAAAGLQGLFGVDFIANSQGVFPIEVNPRLTASVELLERAGDFSAIGLHCHACLQQALPQLPARLRTPAGTMCGKLIVFATDNITTPTGFAAELCHPRCQALSTTIAGNTAAAGPECLTPWPQVADIPPDGTAISTGQPIATVFAAGDTLQSISAELRQKASKLVDGILTPKS